jgi:hypothetical protein
LFDSAPNVTADGLNYFGYTGVWSGAASPTTVGTDASNCANWTSSNASAYGWLGAAGDSWTKGFFDLFEQTISSVCNANWDNLLCLQE